MLLPEVTVSMSGTVDTAELELEPEPIAVYKVLLPMVVSCVLLPDVTVEMRATVETAEGELLEPAEPAEPIAV